MWIESITVLLAVLTPMVGVPMTLITFYLRSMRDQQTSWQSDFGKKVDGLSDVVVELRRDLAQVERDFTTKEEWLRECMHGRRQLESLIQSVTRLEGKVEAAWGAGGVTGRRSRRGGDDGAGVEPVTHDGSAR